MQTLDEKVLLEESESDSPRIDAAMRLAARDALREHKRMGRAIPAWRDGKVIWIAPQDIQVNETDADLEAEMLGTASKNGNGSHRANGSGH